MASGEEKEIIQIEEKPSNEKLNGNGIVLYAYHHCFHSQKVMIALNEKKIPFTVELVDVTKNDQYKPRFLKINPTGTLPVLKDGIKYIPSSKAIIGYLEDNFSNGEYARLIPINQGLDVKQKVIGYYERISKISPYVITMGTIVHNKWCNNLRYPYSWSCVRKSLKASLFSSAKTIRKYASKHDEFESVLLQKADQEEKKIEMVTNQENYTKMMETIESLLSDIEWEFHERDNAKLHWWLCCEQFTIADVALMVLMDRLARLGLEFNFWKGGIRPHVESYYLRVQERDSYKNSMPNPMTDVHFVLNTRGPMLFGVTLLTVISIAIGGFLYFKK